MVGKKSKKYENTKYRVVYGTVLYYYNMAKCIYEITVSVHYYWNCRRVCYLSLLTCKNTKSTQNYLTNGLFDKRVLFNHYFYNMNTMVYNILLYIYTNYLLFFRYGYDVLELYKFFVTTTTKKNTHFWFFFFNWTLARLWPLAVVGVNAL